ncbi:MAG: Crp/Fnr family transcriptional regulator [Nitrospiraceae bacterium]|nr:Crp/Fnr family transcriptional regulator [Nitrospiraceae bacterium]
MVDLKKIGIFQGMSEEDLKSIAPRFKTEKSKKRDILFSEGDPPGWFYIVLEGKVKITKLSQEGKEIILEIIPPLDVFGGVAVIRGIPYPANAVAMEDSVLLRISREDLMQVLGKFPGITFEIFKNLGTRLQDSHESMKNIALEKVVSRVASLLLKLADKSGTETPGGVSIDMKLTKQDIAEMVGSTVETSIRTMSRLKKTGVLEEKDGKIIIRDVEKLKALCS